MNVRPPRDADVEAMAGVAERSYRAGFAEILEPDVLATRDAAFFAGRFSDLLSRMRVAEAAGRVVGFTLVTDGHIEMIFVDPERAGSGAGSALLAQAEAEGARTLECFRDNHAARQFYERRGWRLTREYEREFLGRRRPFVFYERPPRGSRS
jgi:putative acetyltransferase